MAVYFDRALDDDSRRESLYAGNLFVYSPTPASRELCAFARELAEEAFAPHDPTTAQHHMPVEEFAALLAELKPRFIHHPRSKELIPKLLSELGCDLEQTYFDVPRLRTSTSDGYLTAGIAYAFHPHRDTWYSAPTCQLNWWMPVYEIEAANGMAFHPRYWTEPVRNGSARYNYADWVKHSRTTAAKHVKKDTREQPRPEEPMELEPDLRLVPPVGGVIVFSGAQLHSSVENTSGRTRFSIDFRTVHIGDVEAGRGAPNVDSECTGTTMGDYLRGTDLAHVPEPLIQRYEAGPPPPVGRSRSRSVL